MIFRECTGYGFTPTAITLMYLIRASLPGRRLENNIVLCESDHGEARDGFTRVLCQPSEAHF